MEIATGWSDAADSGEAVREAYALLAQRLSRRPSLVLAYYCEARSPEEIARALSRIAPEVPFHGGSSCLGLLTQDGFLHSENGALALWGVHDPEGDYGVGFAPDLKNPEEAGARATRKALRQASRPGESPSLIWINSAPGREERVLEGIESVVGSNVPVMGGSTADDALQGRWSQIAAEGMALEGVVLTAMFPSKEPGLSFHSGYVPTSRSGTVTSARERTIHRIDDRPAAKVYDEWTGGAISPVLPQGGNVLHLTSWYPLGRARERIGNIPLYVLSHPERVLSDKGLTLFSEVHEGEELVLMAGNRDSLVKRAGRVAESALYGFVSDASDPILGGLMIYCGGTLLAVRDEAHRIWENIRLVLGNAPFLVVFTYGEQGRFLQGGNYHGNLMISAVLFSDRNSVI